MSRSKNITPICILLVAVIAGLLIFFSIGFFDRDFPTPQKTLEPEKYPVYYPLRASINGNELSLKVLSESTTHIDVVDIKENLEIKVDPNYGGTVLIVKHWSKKHWGHVTDSAQIVVRTEEIKDLWEERIKESLNDLENKLTKPKDIVPEVYFF